MQQTANSNLDILFLVGILAIPLLLLWLLWLFPFVRHFSYELRYINREIERTKGDERKHWLRQRRRLWLSLLPFIKY